MSARKCLILRRAENQNRTKMSVSVILVRRENVFQSYYLSCFFVFAFALIIFGGKSSCVCYASASSDNNEEKQEENHELKPKPESMFNKFPFLFPPPVVFKGRSALKGNEPVYEGNGLKDAIVKDKCPIPELDLNPPEESNATNFVIIWKRLGWKEAHDFCDGTKGHMATFENEQDALDVIESIFSLSHFSQEYDQGKKECEFGLDRRYWIGLTDLSLEGKWKWVGSGHELTYDSLWTPHQPDHVSKDGKRKSGRLQHCVALWNPSYWKHDGKGNKSRRHSFDDLECDRKHYFICKKDAEKLIRIENIGSGSGASSAKKQKDCPVEKTEPNENCS